MESPTALLERLVRAGGCAACRAWCEGATSGEFSVLYESVNDPDVRERIDRGYGFCRLHGWQASRCAAEQIHSLLGMGLIYRSLTQQLLSDLASPNPRRTRLGRRLAQCYICELAATAERTALRQLSRELRRPEFRQSYERSGGLCLRHLAEFVPLAGRSSAQEAIRDFQVHGPRAELLAGLPPDHGLPAPQGLAAACPVCDALQATRPEQTPELPSPLACGAHRQALLARDASEVWPRVQGAVALLQPARLPTVAAKLRAGHRPPCSTCQALHVREEPLLAAGLHAPGCLRHLRGSIRHGHSAAAQGLVPTLQQLLNDLTEFCRKHDYRFADEPWQGEQDALPRALAFFGGNVDLDAAL
ncbi:MAG: DUF6062 family protein [Chloroflexota bacterium]